MLEMSCGFKTSKLHISAYKSLFTCTIVQNNDDVKLVQLSKDMSLEEIFYSSSILVFLFNHSINRIKRYKL
jgi:hypothetical protein